MAACGAPIAAGTQAVGRAGLADDLSVVGTGREGGAEEEELLAVTGQGLGEAGREGSGQTEEASRFTPGSLPNETDRSWRPAVTEPSERERWSAPG